ncbi:nucleoside/nucleotide kinase family protein [Marinitenerispora sediminis]|uniref:hypothetical protein n=1 Tax=Marinitenerispora sediminis TaxID=1931232 RepID=UPI0013148460|nr:hypothetical protein [Marinitenerispora sediminis]
MLIEVAGIDGSGKTTLVERLRGHLNQRGHHAYYRAWPSTYKRIAADLAHPIPWQEFFGADQIETAAAFENLAAVHHHLAPLDHARQVIITDTYTVRWLATAALNSADPEPLAALYASLRAPDLSLWLDLDPGAARERVLSRPSRDHLTTTRDTGRIARYAQAFAATAGLVPYHRHRVDASAPPGQVAAEAARLLDGLLN